MHVGKTKCGVRFSLLICLSWNHSAVLRSRIKVYFTSSSSSSSFIYSFVIMQH